MFAILQTVVTRVPKEEIERNLQNCLNQTTFVYDFTEVRIQTPECLKCKQKFYFLQEENFTVKFMTEVTSASLITFVNESFGLGDF